MAFCAWILLLSITFLRFIHVVACIGIAFYLPNNVPLWEVNSNMYRVSFGVIKMFQNWIVVMVVLLCGYTIICSFIY